MDNYFTYVYIEKKKLKSSPEPGGQFQTWYKSSLQEGNSNLFK
jgi:hypothetical protein